MQEKKIDGWIDDLVGALFDPIIVYPGGWGDDIPEWLKNKITIERLAENMLALREGRELTATDAEATWYLSSASLCMPLDTDWTQIFLYLATTEINGEKDKVVPDDIKVEALTEQQWHELRRFKAWIYEQRLRHRKAKTRAEHRRVTELEEKERQKLAPVQASFF